MFCLSHPDAEKYKKLIDKFRTGLRKYKNTLKIYIYKEGKATIGNLTDTIDFL